MFQLLVNAVTLTEENIGGKISPLLIRGWKASSMIWRVPSLDLHYTADINSRASIWLLVAGIIQGTFPRYVVPPRPPCMRHCNFWREKPASFTCRLGAQEIIWNEIYQPTRSHQLCCESEHFDFNGMLRGSASETFVSFTRVHIQKAGCLTSWLLCRLASALPFYTRRFAPKSWQSKSQKFWFEFGSCGKSLET